jgi:hypothetical protein
VKIYLVGKDVFRDLPRFSSALIYLKNGVTEISAVKSSGAAHPTATPK